MYTLQATIVLEDDQTIEDYMADNNIAAAFGPSRHVQIMGALRELREANDNGDAISLNDEQMFEMIELLAEELVARLPRYAIEQGDLELSDGPKVEARENLLVQIRVYKDQV